MIYVAACCADSLLFLALSFPVDIGVQVENSSLAGRRTSLEENHSCWPHKVSVRLSGTRERSPIFDRIERAADASSVRSNKILGWTEKHLYSRFRWNTSEDSDIGTTPEHPLPLKLRN